MLSDSLSTIFNSTVISSLIPLSSLSIPSTSGRCFLKFIVYEINSKMIKYGMVVLIEREKADADVTMGWILQSAAGALVGERGRESWRGVGEIEI
jgi:hypothetical protein